MKIWTLTLFTCALAAVGAPFICAEETSGHADHDNSEKAGAAHTPDCCKAETSKKACCVEKASEEKEACCAAGDGPNKVVYSADDAFAFLKTLAGNWRRTSDRKDHGGKGTLETFRISAGGSTVINTIFPGEESEMISVFHRDGEELLLTHYCALQNTPIMKFEKSDKPGLIKFVFKGGTNFDPAVDAHVHEGEIVIRDKDTVEANFTAFAGGKPLPMGKALLQREPTVQVEAK
jgi:hypothetical protein